MGTELPPSLAAVLEILVPFIIYGGCLIGTSAWCWLMLDACREAMKSRRERRRREFS